MNCLKDESVQGAWRKQNIILAEQVQLQNLEIEKNEHDQSDLKANLDNVSRQLHKCKLQHDQNLKDAIIAERQKLLALECQLRESINRSSNLKDIIDDVETSNSKLVEKLRYSEERNIRYEKENGIAETAVYQRKLEADLIRRDMDLASLNKQIEECQVRCKILESTCMFLKEKCGSLKDCSLSEEELKDAFQSRESKMEFENAELIKQNQKLENG